MLQLFNAAASLTKSCWKEAAIKPSPILQGADARRRGQGRAAGLRGQIGQMPAGFTRGSGVQPPVTITGVAPWAKPVSQGGMPATVAPWAKNVNVSASLGAVKRPAASQMTSASEPSNEPFERAIAASQVLGYITATPEAADFAVNAPDMTVGNVMAASELLTKKLSGIGSNTGDGEHCDGGPEAADALRDVLYQVRVGWGLRDWSASTVVKLASMVALRCSSSI